MGEQGQRGLLNVFAREGYVMGNEARASLLDIET